MVPVGWTATWIESPLFAVGTSKPPFRSGQLPTFRFALMPAGPKTRCVPMFGDGFGVASASQRKEAAWRYCQWATGKANQTRQIIGGYGGSVRKSAHAAVAAASNVKAPREWLKVVEQSGPIASAALPQIVTVGQFRDTFGAALTNMLGGSDAAAELRRATDEFRPILTQTENTSTRSRLGSDQRAPDWPLPSL
jgi:multiple sugar transport system substrate-binding protein